MGRRRPSLTQTRSLLVVSLRDGRGDAAPAEAGPGSWELQPSSAITQTGLSTAREYSAVVVTVAAKAAPGQPPRMAGNVDPGRHRLEHDAAVYVGGVLVSTHDRVGRYCSGPVHRSPRRPTHPADQRRQGAATRSASEPVVDGLPRPIPFGQIRQANSFSLNNLSLITCRSPTRRRPTHLNEGDDGSMTRHCSFVSPCLSTTRAESNQITHPALRTGSRCRIRLGPLGRSVGLVT
ncbi:hypothetical protein BZB76_0089 [Actinomadura pelletieri DSM 43383]|uniref:Uncharacterized protein n=1 Tax=Actinomadura pelletieri DSM 43383 TaxID=1120940 RepID=A0A495QWW2_9ACTN|nr:hypothetical protein BZB76_0089 [Actinomadura pelletieri DSM 43383]